MWHTRIGKLSAELEAITAAGGDARNCVKKIYAAASRDSELYITLLEEELAEKRGVVEAAAKEFHDTQAVTDTLRRQFDTLYSQQSDVLQWLREAREEKMRLQSENVTLKEDLADAVRRLDAATGLVAEAGVAEAGSQRLIANLEEENRRVEARATRAEERCSELRAELARAEAWARRCGSERDYWRQKALGEARAVSR